MDPLGFFPVILWSSSKACRWGSQDPCDAFAALPRRPQHDLCTVSLGARQRATSSLGQAARSLRGQAEGSW